MSQFDVDTLYILRIVIYVSGVIAAHRSGFSGVRSQNIENIVVESIEFDSEFSAPHRQIETYVVGIITLPSQKFVRNQRRHDTVLPHAAEYDARCRTDIGERTQESIGRRAGVVAQGTERCTELEVVDRVAQGSEEVLLRHAPSERYRREESPAASRNVADKLIRPVITSGEFEQIFIGIIVLSAENQSDLARSVAGTAYRLICRSRRLVQFGQLRERNILTRSREFIGLVIAGFDQRQQIDFVFLRKGIFVADAGLRGNSAPLRESFGQVIGFLAGRDIRIVARIRRLGIGDIRAGRIRRAGQHEEVRRAQDFGCRRTAVVRPHDLQAETLYPRKIPLQGSIGLHGYGL